MVLTFAGVSDPAVVEAWHTGLAAASLRVVLTLQTFAADAITTSHNADVNVAITLAGPAGSSPTGAPCWVAIKSFLTDVTART